MLDKRVDISVEALKTKVDSLYRLVLIAARRANQLQKSEASHALTGGRARKCTIAALEEVMEGKVSYVTRQDGEDEFIE